MTEDSGIANFFCKPKVPIMNTPVSTRIFTADSSTTGKGSVDRTEELKTNVAGVVTQVWPNGSLVIEGKQEIRVNFEVRELIVAGVVRRRISRATTRSTRTRSRRRESRMEAVVRLPICSRAVITSSSSTYSCHSSPA